MYEVALAVLAIYLMIVAAWDLKTLRVPNWLTLPVLAGVLIWRIVRVVIALRGGNALPGELGFLLYIFGVWMLWSAGMMGGGDAKLLMILFCVFPAPGFLALLLFMSGATMLTVLICRYARHGRVGKLASNILFRVQHGLFFPSDAELEAEGEPTAFLFSVSGMAWIVLLTF